MKQSRYDTLNIMFNDLTVSAQKKYLEFYGYSDDENPNENIPIVILEHDD